ncbi:hypothetical protein Q3G72_006061 [Acer saccharum]|nr:hypothetical protein Q3G72_006061 [Acer saccharum]
MIEKEDRIVEASLDESMSSPDNSFSHISETPFSQQITDGMVRSKGGRSVKNRILSKKGICNRSSVKIHGMKTRKDKSLLPQVAEEIGNRNMGATSGKGRWNLDDEITKIIEKGVALGFINIRKSVKRNGPESAIVEHGKSESWNLSDEVAKVIETGIALGIDFNGHPTMDCSKASESSLVEGGAELPFGPWLRAIGPEKLGGQRGRRSGSQTVNQRRLLQGMKSQPEKSIEEKGFSVTKTMLNH